MRYEDRRKLSPDPARPRRCTRRAHGVRKEELAEIKAFEASKKDIAGKKWPTTYVLPSCTCSAHPFPHYHPGMKWTEEEKGQV